ncbi:MAG TPA: hypothetical protein VK474_12945 [Chthoniobacterales bacterium]|nr:hypothetical protein [Chthoniobacterales bacterium]
MKRLFTVLAFAGVLGLIGCANEGPTSAELQDQVGRGLRGEGRLTPEIDRSDDPYVKSREGAFPPRQ